MKTGFIGLGLIGGSIAKAIRQYYPDSEIIAFDKNRETLALATAESVINTAVTVIDENFKGCDYLFLCAPVIYNSAYLSQVKPFLSVKQLLSLVNLDQVNLLLQKLLWVSWLEMVQLMVVLLTTLGQMRIQVKESQKTFVN